MIATTSRRALSLLTMLFVPLCFAQAPASTSPAQARAIVSVQKAAVAALNFPQGDAAAFNRARADFTADGWKDFLAHMEGFLDANGAPTFTCRFVVRRDARLLDEKDGVLHIRIPGSLTQSNKLGKTVYDRAAIEVHAVRDPSAGRIKIQKLEQVTCLGASKSCD